MQIKSGDDYQKTYKRSVEEPEQFWGEIASEFEWEKKWDKVVDYDLSRGYVKWFEGGKTNITVNCLDRHLGDETALIWEPDNPSKAYKSYSYTALYHKVCRFANGLKELGVKKGDRICFYMPMVPELLIGVLASARIGAVHSVVFAGFSAKSLADRIIDAKCKIVVTADYSTRGGKNIPVKAVVDQALIHGGCNCVEHVLVFKNTGDDIPWYERDLWMGDLIKNQARECEPEIMDASDPLFILYTSGSTGSPKGIVHHVGGYMVYTCYSFLNVFQYQASDIYWCTADIGWITGHSYIVYGPLLAGATTVMFEGVPMWPEPDRFWQIVDRHNINQFYTAPTAIRALMARGDDWPEKHDLGSLKVLGTVGEPINEEAWHWYYEKIGKEKLPIVDTWWQTETGGIMISSIPGAVKSKPTYATKPLPGIQPVLLGEDREIINKHGKEGLLCIQYPWPSMIRTIWGDHERCVETYYSLKSGMYFSGDSAKKDEEGNYRIIGRVDDVINVSGHRLGTAEIEDAINGYPDVVESAVIGISHEIKGQAIMAYVITSRELEDVDEVVEGIRQHVRKEIGPIAKPDRIVIVPGLPKTRSGKIMRRILRKIAAGEVESLGDTSTLINPEIIEELKERS